MGQGRSKPLIKVFARVRSWIKEMDLRLRAVPRYSDQATRRRRDSTRNLTAFRLAWDDVCGALVHSGAVKICTGGRQWCGVCVVGASLWCDARACAAALGQPVFFQRATVRSCRYGVHTYRACSCPAAGPSHTTTAILPALVLSNAQQPQCLQQQSPACTRATLCAAVELLCLSSDLPRARQTVRGNDSKCTSTQDRKTWRSARLSNGECGCSLTDRCRPVEQTSIVRHPHLAYHGCGPVAIGAAGPASLARIGSVLPLTIATLQCIVNPGTLDRRRHDMMRRRRRQTGKPEVFCLSEEHQDGMCETHSLGSQHSGPSRCQDTGSEYMNQAELIIRPP